MLGTEKKSLFSAGKYYFSIKKRRIFVSIKEGRPNHYL